MIYKRPRYFTVDIKQIDTLTESGASFKVEQKNLT